MRGIVNNKKGASEWTMSKLVALILLVAVIILVIIGVYTGALNPLGNRLKETWNYVLGFFGEKDVGGGGDRDCLDPIKITEEKFIKAVSGGSFILCKTYCEVDLDGLGRYRLNLENGKFEKYGEIFTVYGLGIGLQTTSYALFRYNDVLSNWEWRLPNSDEWKEALKDTSSITWKLHRNVKKYAIEVLASMDYDTGKDYLVKSNGKISMEGKEIGWMDIEHEIIPGVEEMKIQREVYTELIKQVEEQSKADRMVEINGEKYLLDLEKIQINSKWITMLFIKDKKIPYGLGLSNSPGANDLVPSFDIYKYSSTDNKWIKMDENSQNIARGVSGLNLDMAIKVTKIKEFLEAKCI